MSRIFDALQRAEVDNLEADLSELSAATEVLQRAELRTISQRKAEDRTEHSETAESPEFNTPFSLHAMSQVVAAVEASVTDAASPKQEHARQFEKFQSLQISVPAQNRLVCLTNDEGLAAEKFRFLGIRLQHLRRERALRRLLITSTIPQEGKSMVAGNLACTLARKATQKTLLLEGDVRRPSLSAMFGLGKIPGICDYLQGERSLAESIYHLEDAGLWILPAGTAPKNPLELLQSGKLTSLMDQLSAWFDWIIIDSPPVLPLGDTSVWMRLADGILLVARQGTTEKRQLQRGLEAIESKKLIGALLNGSETAARNDYYYSYRPSDTTESKDRLKE